MTRLAPTLQAYFTTRLVGQYGASPHTIAAYRDSWSLLLRYLADTNGTPPQAVDFADLTADVIGDFLTHLEDARGNSVATRNARLAASGWRRSTHCSPTPPTTIPSTPRRSAGS